MLVEIWSDVVCPWCYIGKRRFESALAEFEHASEVEVVWRSFELDPTAPFRRSGDMAGHLAAKYGMSVDDAAARLRDMDELAGREGLRFDLARTQSGNTLDAHRLIHLAAEEGPQRAAEMKEALLHAYFEELEPISEPDTLREVAAGIGLDPGTVETVLSSDRYVAEVRRDEAEAASLGCTGVPFFVVDRRFAVPGAQDADTFLAVLRRAWERAESESDAPAAGGACEGDACAV
jgi:predicted DsbA family dithiol-disulfide isomerase